MAMVPPGMGMPGMPPGLGMPPGMPPGAPPGVDPMAGMNPDMALDAMQAMMPKPANPTSAMAKVTSALDKMHDLAMLCIPQVSQWNPKLARDLHAIAKQVVAAKLDLTAEQQLGPPPDLMLGMQGGLGLPPGMGPGMGGG